MGGKPVSLDDKYTKASGRVYLSGLQALVRIPLIQHQLDKAAGLNTACFVSGYRGSPLGGFDMALERARAFTKDAQIHFQPGVNEDLGATAVWGSQQVGISPLRTRDGVLGIWYGKGPGVDRSVDVIKHANAAGTSRHGGVLAYVGDDHACKSSTFPHQSEHALISAMVPVLNPAGLQDVLDLGVLGVAMSRFSGCWVAIKCVSDLVDSSASVETDPFGITIYKPEDFSLPPGGLNIRWPDPPVEQEARLIHFKLPAVRAFARANALDHPVWEPQKKRIGIVATGKAYMDACQALADLGITQEMAEKELGLGLYKVRLVWPLDDISLRGFAKGYEEILVIEEKRGLIEEQIKTALYNLPESERPLVTGKTDEAGKPLLPETYELWPARIATTLIARLKRITDTKEFESRNKVLRAHDKLTDYQAPVERKPWYCSGCPHNTSTVVPDGSRALAGIACHYMAMWMDRSTSMFTQMGGEGVPWIGQSPFTKEEHVFANLGDGTYFHSGLLAIRASVAAGVNITYKILYNDAVAMTGGQPVDGSIPVEQIARQVEAEGVKTIYVVSDEPWKYGPDANFPPGTIIEHRDELEAIQRTLRTIPGATVLIYDQTCAAEKRRRRKRGLMEDPQKRVMINEMVCEGCGDCGKKSNCLSLTPVETEYGRKRQIDQSSCNKDYSCLKGFCPSFVTVKGAELRMPDTAREEDIDAAGAAFSDMPTPEPPELDDAYSILVTGIGGTGVVTIGALVAMAAHIEGKGCTTMDQTGLAQKGGAVTSHVRIADTPEGIHTVRISAGEADLVLGCDLLVTADGDALSKMSNETRVVLNTHETSTGDFTRDADWTIPTQKMIGTIAQECGKKNIDSVEATRLATALLGDSIATNLFVLGYAWQKGLIPLAEKSILQAVRLNGAAVEMNEQAFLWGRRAAHNLQAVTRAAEPSIQRHPRFNYRRPSTSVEEVVDRRMASLTRYQDAAYAEHYRKLVAAAAAAETETGLNKTDFSGAVARYYYKLMAYKDEYEVARLYTDGTFTDHLSQVFEDGYKLKFHLAPPLLARRDKVTGEPRKMEFGGWVLHVFRVLAKLKSLRGTAFDIFGYTAERKIERQLIKDYEATVLELVEGLNADNYGVAVEIAKIPEHIRGFGHVKERHIKEAKAREAALLEQFRNPAPRKQAA